MEVDLDAVPKSSVAIRVTEEQQMDVGRDAVEDVLKGIDSEIRTRVQDVNSARSLTPVEYNLDWAIDTGNVTTFKGAELSAPGGSPGLPMSAVAMFVNGVNSIYDAGDRLAKIRRGIAKELRAKHEDELKEEQSEGSVEVQTIDTNLGNIDGVVFASLDTVGNLERPMFSPEIAFMPTVEDQNVVTEYRVIDDILDSFGYETTLIQGSQQMTIDNAEQITYRGFMRMIEEIQDELDGLPLNIMLSSAVKKDFSLIEQ